MATSVAIGPDGAFYVSELKGFPAPLGMSRIWRIEPDARHVQCDPDVTDGPCTLVADGFTSIVDLTFGPDGTAYVTELDEASWFAVEVATDGMVGGTVNTCDPTTWVCTEEATDLTMPMAVAINEARRVRGRLGARPRRDRGRAAGLTHAYRSGCHVTIACVKDARVDIPETRYAKTADGVHIAYQVFGDGPVDILFVLGWVTHRRADVDRSAVRAVLRPARLPDRWHLYRVVDAEMARA